MRSYSYKAGIWETCKDTLPPSMYYHSKASRERGWLEKVEAYKTGLEVLGFNKEGTRYSCLLGEMRVHTRNHATLSMNRTTKEFQYDFLGVVETGGSYIRVWIQDFNDLLLFMREVDGKPLDEILKDFLDGDNMRVFLASVSTAMDFLSNDHISIEVRHPKP